MLQKVSRRNDLRIATVPGAAVGVGGETYCAAIRVSGRFRGSGV